MLANVSFVRSFQFLNSFEHLHFDFGYSVVQLGLLLVWGFTFFEISVSHRINYIECSTCHINMEKFDFLTCRVFNCTDIRRFNRPVSRLLMGYFTWIFDP